MTLDRSHRARPVHPDTTPFPFASVPITGTLLFRVLFFACSTHQHKQPTNKFNMALVIVVHWNQRRANLVVLPAVQFFPNLSPTLALVGVIVLCGHKIAREN